MNLPGRALPQGTINVVNNQKTGAAFPFVLYG